MEEEEFTTYREWGMQMARLIELIAMTNRTIQVHKEGGDSGLYIKQYEELLERHTDELQELMRVMGLAVQLTPLSNVA